MTCAADKNMHCRNNAKNTDTVLCGGNENTQLNLLNKIQVKAYKIMQIFP